MKRLRLTMACAILASAVFPALAATEKCDKDDPAEKTPSGQQGSPEALMRQLETVREQVAAKMGLKTNEVLAGMIAAALVQKNADTSEPESMRRLTEASSFYRPIVPVIRAASLPDEFKALLETYYASIVVFPIRQGAWGMDGVGEGELFKAIPPGGSLVTIGGGETVAGHVEKVFPAWKTLTPVRRKVLMDYLDSINPHIAFEHMFRTAPAAVKGDHFTCELMANPLRPQMYGVLESIAPSLSPFPPPAPDGKGRGECIAVPVDAKSVVASCYRVEPSARVFLPPPECLASVADPKHLNLRNSWVADLSGLAGMHPETIDLSGCMVSDVRPLAAMKSLATVRLTGNPVSDLSPLKGMKLRDLDLVDTLVKDLSPLAGMPLERLALKGSKVADITALAKIGTLRKLEMDRTSVTNLAPLQGLPLEYLTLAQAGNYADFAPISKIETLKTVGDVPLERWIEENKFLREKKAFVAAPAGGTQKAPAKEQPLLAPPKKPKSDEPPDVLPSLDLSL